MILRSFWLAGFECSCHINSRGVRLDMTAAIQHDTQAREDYRRLREVGMLAARDGLRWHLIDRGGNYDWSSWLPMLDAARDEGIQILWDLCHYGWPDELDIFSADFVRRFAAFSREAALLQLEHTGEPGLYVPINEISFFTWAATRDLFYPYAWDRGGELKEQLVRATIASCEAIRSVDAKARIASAEPMIYNFPPRWRPWLTEPARIQYESQFEAWDMIRDRAPEFLDIVGVNFYAANEWEVPGGRKLHWDAGSDDPRWVPLHRMLANVYERYRRPILITETSHYGIGRAPWLEEISQECRIAIQQGIPLEGACLYPILDRFDWENCNHWHNSGLWDLERTPEGEYRRILNREYAAELEKAQDLQPTG
jgi:beta-glucosidase/6-phospho-beta-glucosidase/beta-galactosidase